MRRIPPEQLLKKPVRHSYVPIHKLPKGQREAVLQAWRHQERRKTEAMEIYRTGEALEKIKREKVYEKLGFNCFQAFCRSTFDFDADHAGDYIRLSQALAGYARRGELEGKVFGMEHLKLIGRIKSPYQELMIEHGSGVSRVALRHARDAGLACGEDTERGEQVVLQILRDAKNSKQILAALRAELAGEVANVENLSPPATAAEQAEAAKSLMGSVIKLLDGGELDSSQVAELSEDENRQLLRRALAMRESVDRLVARLDGRDPPRGGPAGPITEEEGEGGEGGLVKAPAGRPAAGEPDKAGQPAANGLNKEGQPEGGLVKAPAGRPAAGEPDKAGQPAANGLNKEGQPEGGLVKAPAGRPAAGEPDKAGQPVPAGQGQDTIAQDEAGRPATMTQEPPLTPLVLDDQMLAFVQQVGRAIAERVEPCYQTVWQRKVVDALRGRTGLWEPKNLEGHWERFTDPNLPDLGLDPALWGRYCAAVLGDDYRLRFAHLLPAMLAAGLPDSTLHLHLLIVAAMPEDMKRMIIDEANRRPLVELSPSLTALSAENQSAAEAVAMIENAKVAKFWVDRLEAAMESGKYRGPPPLECRQAMLEAVEAENAALAAAKTWQIPLPRRKR